MIGTNVMRLRHGVNNKKGANIEDWDVVRIRLMQPILGDTKILLYYS